MTTSPQFQLPTLRDKVRFHAVPRRYEETKPVQIQDFSHKRIIYIGSDIYRKSLQQNELDKQKVVRSTEDRVWSKAEKVKEDAVVRAVKETQLDHEKVIKKLVRSHEKALKEQAVRIESEMNKLVVESVQQEREEGEARLNTAVANTEARCHQELLDAVAQARREEIEKAANEVARVKKENQEKYDQALQAAAVDKKQCLEALDQRKDQERKAAVAEVHRQEQAEAKDKLTKQRELYEQNIRVLHTHIAEHKAECVKLEGEIKKILGHKDEIKQELLDIREDFQHFINRVRPYIEGEADYLIPPIKSFVLSYEMSSK